MEMMLRIFAKLLTMMDVNLTIDALGANPLLSHLLANLLTPLKPFLHLFSIVTILMDKMVMNLFQELITVREIITVKALETIKVKAQETITEKDQVAIMVKDQETTKREMDITAIMVLLQRDAV